MAKRGQLTSQIIAKGRELLGVELTQRELRLMPYIQNCVIDGRDVEPRKVNADDRVILSQWRERGWISGGAVDLEVSEHFWTAIHDLLWLGYVTYEDQPDE